jgi:hypothetical protein
MVSFGEKQRFIGVHAAGKVRGRRLRVLALSVCLCIRVAGRQLYCIGTEWQACKAGVAS